MTPQKRPVQTVRTPGANPSPAASLAMAPRPSLADIAQLSVYLPAKLNSHDNTSSFMEEVARAALEALDTCARPAPKEVHSALGELAGSARAFRSALGALHDPHTAGRLKLHLDESAELIERLRGDVEALTAGCESAAKSLQRGGAATPATQAARGLVVRVGMAHLRCFESLPSQHGWFADDFMRHLGQKVGITIERDVVIEMVRLLEQES